MYAGIESGDIGPTVGVVALEEGWCRFTHVKLPRIALLARHGHVTKEGTFVRPPQKFSKRTYATIMAVRAGMVASSASLLGTHVTASNTYVRECVGAT